MAQDEQLVVDAATDPLNRAENAARLKGLEFEEAKLLYDQVCTNVRTTDDISFKLLGFVPLVSGVGITVFLSMQASISVPILIFIGAFGAVVTSGLYLWERKNINLCRWLIRLGEDLERHSFGLTQGQFLDRPDPTFLGWTIRKWRAERIIYLAAIVAWVLLPVVRVIS